MKKSASKGSRRPDPLGGSDLLPLKRAQKEFVDRLGLGCPRFKLLPKIRLYEKSIQIPGDLTLGEDQEWTGSFIDGDLIVDGNLFIVNRAIAGVLLVVGKLQAKSIVNWGGNLLVKGDLVCEGPLVHSPPHHFQMGAIKLNVWGLTRAQVVVGEVSTHGGTDSAVFPTGFRPSGPVSLIRFTAKPDGPQRIAATFVPEVLQEGGVGLVVDRVMEHVRQGQSIVTDGSSSPETSLVEKLESLDRKTHTDLDLRGLELGRLFDQLFEFKQLTTLNLSDNHLAQLDERVGRLGKLKRLDLTKNRIQTWPNIERVEQILTDGACARSLEELYLDGGRFTARIGKLTALRRLCVREMRFPLPVQLFSLPHLTHLSLGAAEYSSQANDFPAKLASLGKLESLEIDGGIFEEVPRALGKLTALRTIVFRCGFRRAKTFAPLKGLTKLESFAFSGRGFEDKPSNSSFIEEIFDGLAGIQLRQLSLRDWGRALDHRRASGKQVTRAAMERFPDRFADFPMLRAIDLTGNGLRELPPSLFSLRHLEELNVEENELTDSYLAEVSSRLPKMRIEGGRQRKPSSRVR